KGGTEACRLWWWAWQKLKPFIVEHGLTNVDDLDRLLPGENSIYDWCQEMEQELGNVMDKAWVFALRRIAYAGEFPRLLPASDVLILQNMRRAVAESYDFLGDKDQCDAEFRRLVEDYPHWAWGYVGWGDTYWMSLAPGREKDYARSREIYAAGLPAGTDEQEVLQERLAELEAESKLPVQPQPLASGIPALTDACAWFTAYKKGSPLAQYRLFLAIARQQPPESFAARLEQGELACEAFSLLEKNNLQEEAVELLEALQANWSEYYSKEFYYFDPFLVSRCLYLDQPGALPGILRRFHDNPVSSIDSLLPVFSSLVTYERRDLMREMAEGVLPVVSSSEKLIPGAEIDFAMALFSDRLERVYAQKRAGEKADWVEFNNAVAPFDFEVKPKLVKEIDALWSGEWTGEELRAELAKDFGRGLTLLGFGFNKYMLEEKGMGFPCSRLIWAQFENLLRKHREESKKKAAAPSFDFTLDLLDRTVAEQLGLGFFGLSNKKVDAIALVWGLPYISDYLHSQMMLDAGSRQRILDIVTQVKEMLFEAIANDLWKYAFVQRWEPADSVEEHFRRYEADIFTHSFRRRVPLKD
ncbi:MAG: hypothetical protein M1609_09200, partial [Firmicutes bacterium]|nr:hypothetical protein [Bacillota bacterium]